jgi:3-hydroxyisobutyrate dehydrogenase-like beta-hydroxyacid dehydrogenase
MNVGFVGLGIMGVRMAGNLLRGGHSLVVFNRTPEKSRPLETAGARAVRTPAEAARGVSLLFTMLSTPDAVTSMALGKDGFLGALTRGSLWIDCSSVDPSFSRHMALEASRLAVRFMDAPVTGSLAVAEKGELTFLAGGDAADLKEARPLLQLMGKTIRHLGPVGMGSAMKMIINMQLGALMAAFSEALALGESLGFSRTILLDTLVGGPVAGPFLAGKRTKLETHAYEPEFPLRWQQKDLHLACTTAWEQGVPMPVINAAKEAFMAAAADGMADLDFSAVAELHVRKH